MKGIILLIIVICGVTAFHDWSQSMPFETADSGSTPVFGIVIAVCVLGFMIYMTLRDSCKKS